MARYSKWISLLALVLMAIACFLPWTFHADIQKTFNGFFSEKNIYGKPARFLLFMGGIGTALSFLPKLWAKRAAFLVTGLNMAYAVKNFLLFGSCYQGYCPEKKSGLYIMILSAALLLIMSFFPQGKLEQENTLAKTPEQSPE